MREKQDPLVLLISELRVEPFGFSSNHPASEVSGFKSVKSRCFADFDGTEGSGTASASAALSSGALVSGALEGPISSLSHCSHCPNLSFSHTVLPAAKNE